MTTVINLKDKKAVEEAKKEGNFIRIDRKTKWGNPFKIGEDGNRQEVIELYIDLCLVNWILEKDTYLKQLDELKGKILGCWCKPDLCHGDILGIIAEDWPDCLNCNTKMKPAFDTVAKKYTKYNWKCNCSPGLFISIG